MKNDIILVAASGEMRAGNTMALNEYLLPYIDRAGAGKRIYIDLSRCYYMDSTFIGFITALTIKCRRKTCDVVSVVNPSEKARASLKKLSAMGELHIVDAVPDDTIPLFALGPAESSFKTRTDVELIFEAHQTLSDLSPQNQAEFKDLLDELRRVLDHEKP